MPGHRSSASSVRDGVGCIFVRVFLTELCAVPDLPQPYPAGDDTKQNAHVFEHRVKIANLDGSSNCGVIDLNRRDSFVLKAKQSGNELDSACWHIAMLAAHDKADNYVRAHPSDEGGPLFNNHAFSHRKVPNHARARIMHTIVL